MTQWKQEQPPIQNRPIGYPVNHQQPTQRIDENSYLPVTVDSRIFLGNVPGMVRVLFMVGAGFAYMAALFFLGYFVVVMANAKGIWQEHAAITGLFAAVVCFAVGNYSVMKARE